MIRVIALALVATLVLPNVVHAQGAVDWGQVDGLPAGTRLRLVLTNGTEATGTVVATTAETVVMRDNRPGATGEIRTQGAAGPLRDNITFNRAEVATANVVTMPTRLTLVAGSNNAGVRHVVRGLGVGKKIDLRTGSSWLRRTTITAVGDESFEVSNRQSPARVDYGAVRDIKPAGMHRAAKAGIIAGTAFGALLLIGGLAVASCAC